MCFCMYQLTNESSTDRELYVGLLTFVVRKGWGKSQAFEVAEVRGSLTRRESGRLIQC